MRIIISVMIFFWGVCDLIAYPQDVYQSSFATGLIPPERISIDECANRYRYLPVDTAEGGGQLIDTSRTPYIPEITDCLSPDSPIQQVRVMKGAQIAVSTAAENFGFHTIKYGLGKFMYVMPTIDGVKAVSTEKFSSMIADSPAITDLVASLSSRTQVNTTFDKDFLGGRLLFRGATSPNGLRQTSVGKFVIDEEDAMDVTSEGDPVAILLKRANTFGRKLKMLRLSTPLIKGFSRIEKAYEDSDQRIFKIPCPHCQHMQEIDFARFNKVPGNVFMTCENGDCEFPIYEDQKYYFLERGKWHRRYHQVTSCFDFIYQDTPFKEGHIYWVKIEDLQQLLDDGKVADMVQTIAGFHISGLYSPLGWYSWTQAVIEYIAAKDAPELMKVFVNTVLGLTWEDHIQMVEAEELLERRQKICKRDEAEVPARATVITCAVDTQNNRLEALVVAWGITEDGMGIERWPIDKEIFYGDPDEAQVWQDLTAFRQKTYLSDRGHRMHISITGIDSGGGRTQAVYDYCHRHQGVHALKGQPGDTHPIAKIPSKIKTDDGRTIELRNIGTYTCKDRIFTILQKGYKGVDKITFPIAEWCDREFFEQVCSEKLLTKYRGKLAYREWSQTRARNEMLDVMVYNMGLLYYMSSNPRSYLKMLNAKISAAPAAQQAASSRKKRKSNVKKSNLL